MIGRVHNVDCLNGMDDLKCRSVDFVFADLPYGRTQQRWDKHVPVEKLWKQLAGVCKLNAAMVFTAVQPFTSLLVVSRLDWFRYEMIWRKNKPTSGFLNSKKQPLRAHENALVFYREQPMYEPQMTDGHKPGNAVLGRSQKSTLYGAAAKKIAWGGSTKRYPTSVLDIPVLNSDSYERVHSNQKPEELAAWFIRTYTKPGDVVLDPTAGSGSTLLAAKKLGRRFVGFETDKKMCVIANNRLKAL